MEVICLQEDAFYALVEQVYERMKALHGQPIEKWIEDEEAMQLLKIKSRTTLQKLRNEGKIRFSHPEKKIILYDRDSILEYLENNAVDTF